MTSPDGRRAQLCHPPEATTSSAKASSWREEKTVLALWDDATLKPYTIETRGRDESTASGLHTPKT